MSKKSLSETDICTQYITPAIVKSGWELRTQIRQEVNFTKGKLIIKGQKTDRMERKRADYILYYKGNIKIAVIEAKDNNHNVGAGMQQALDYGVTLDAPFVFSSNGDAFLEHDRTGNAHYVEKELTLDAFPSPEDLWKRYKEWKGIVEDSEHVLLEDIFGGSKKPYYYQEIAINRTVEAISKGQNRILLVMATGTGKTYVASQVIYKLWKSKAKKRILFLADRNILVDQARNNDFKIFKGAMTKIKNRKVDTSYEIYLALYQAVSGSEEWRNIYQQFSKDFFDLVIVDECHRGSAAEDSAWREVLEYFESATQIGMTATPKEDKQVSNIDYFGEPIYTYSLKQGIQDGFLAPYRVIQVTLDKDKDGYKPGSGKKDKYGYVIPNKTYMGKDFDREMVIDERTLLVAHKVTEFLKKTNRFDKTIVFCVDIDHADRMRSALVNENSDLVAVNEKYVVKITGDDDYGKKELDNFIEPSSKYPVIVTTSKLLSTGVDVQTCKLIVLDSNIQSMTEFKQIIGRGTRLREDYGKSYFTIMDFRGVTKHFADPDFDGEPIQDPDFNLDEQNGNDTKSGPKTPSETQRKYYVNNVEVNVVKETVQLFNSKGKQIKQPLTTYIKRLALAKFNSLDNFVQQWNAADKKTALIQEMINQGIFLNELHELKGKEFDDFDLMRHFVFDQKLLTRKERADRATYALSSKYNGNAKVVINALLDKYCDEGIESIESIKILKVNPFIQIGTPVEIVGFFGGKSQYLSAIHEIENKLYK